MTAILDNPKFDDAKTTVFYFYGITNDKKTMEVVSLRDAYLSNDDYNFVLVTIRSFLYNFLVTTCELFSYFLYSSKVTANSLSSGLARVSAKL